MKKFFKFLGGFLIVILILLLVVPYFFKDTILEKAKTEVNNMVNAKVEIADASLSMFRSFPSLYVGLNDIVVIGENEFKNDTLANVREVYATVNLFSAITGALKITSLGLNKTTVKAKVLESGKANWDIMKPSEQEGQSTSSKTESSSSDFKLVFKKVKVTDFALAYDDIPLNTSFSFDKLNMILSGDFSAKATNLNVKSSITKINLNYNDIRYLADADVKLDALIDADLEHKSFTFKKNKLGLNDLYFSIVGNFKMLPDSYNMDLNMHANKADFKSLLALVPDVFKTEMEGLETAGKFEMTAFAKGTYQNDNYPEFGAKLNVGNAFIKYASLPESVDRIKIDAEINHKQGNLDLLTCDINQFAFEVAKNPFTAEFHLKNPISDPLMSGMAKGIIDFKNLKKAIPLDSVSIAGLINSDIQFNGRYSDIEKEQYDKFNMKGKADLRNFAFKSRSFPQGIFIKKSILQLTSRYIHLKSFNANIGRSDLGLVGKVENYIPYFMKGKTLRGNFNVSSNMFDTNEFITSASAPKQDTISQTTTDTIPLSVIEIPTNLDLKLVSKFRTIRYQKMDIKNMNGLIVVKNATAKLTNLSMQMLKGSMQMSGLYGTKDITKPNVNFNLNINNFDINSAYNSITTVKEMVPMAMNCSGKVSAKTSFKSVLDAQMQPIPTSLNGSGSLHSKKILISENKALNALAIALKNDTYKRISLEELNINYIIKNGNIEVKPFSAKVAGHKAQIYGTQSVDGKLDFTMMIKLPKEELGSEVTQFFDKLPGMENIGAFDVGVKIVGTVDNPKVKVDLKKAIEQAKKAVTKELKRKAKKELEKKGKDILKRLFN